MHWLTSYELLGNRLLAWATAAGITLLALLALAAIKAVLVNRLGAVARQGSTADRVFDSLAYMLGGTRLWLLFFQALNFGLQTALDLPDRAYSIAGNIAAVALFVQVGIWGTRQVRFWVDSSRTRAAQDTNLGATTSLGAINFIAMTVLWSLVLLVILQNLGVDITALVAGLGVGGIAVALAVQNILGDLFASLSIVIDKPFVVGDFVVIDEFAGTIEHVGLKTTRIRSLSGEQLVFSNSDMLSTRVRNYKRMDTRRIVFEFGVPHHTPVEQLEAIPRLVREIVEGIDTARFDRSHFKGFSPSAFDFETVYIMQTPDFNAYMDVQQVINLGLVKRFAERGIRFAYPTRTLDVPAPVQVAMAGPAAQ